MKARKAIMDFIRFTVALLIEFAINVVAKMNGNPDFNNPDIPLTDLSAAITKLSDAVVAADAGGRFQHELMYKAKKELISLLRDETAYVNRISKGDTAKIVGSGFHLSKAPAPRTILEFWAENGLNPGEVMVGCKRIIGAKAYIWEWVQMETLPDEESWKPAGVSVQRRMSLQNLEIKKTAWFRFCGVTRYGMLPWSEPIKILVL
jgi:hypothetical protein